jgi:tetratricopeptide (TPR) repeat protein
MMGFRDWLSSAGAAYVVLAMCSLAGGDTVHLKGGLIYEGKVTSAPNDAVVVIETSSGTVQISASRVLKIVKGNANPTTQPDPINQPVPNPNPMPQVALREKYAELRASAESLTDGEAGLKLWQAAAPAFKGSAQESMVQKELDEWKYRVDHGLVKFGPQWVPLAQVQERLSKADELIKSAAGSLAVDDAIKLLDQAAKAHPFRADIPFLKGLQLCKARRLSDAGLAFGDAIKLDANHMAARNNIAVLAAAQKQWQAAISNSSKAAAIGDNDIAFDNLDLVLKLADDGGTDPADIAEADRQLRVQITRLHVLGKHVGQNRWGSGWIDEDEYQKNVKINAGIDSKTGAQRKQLARLKSTYAKNQQTYEDCMKKMNSSSRVSAYDPTLSDKASKAMDDNRDISRQMSTVRQQISQLSIGRIEPPHADSLILLNLEGTEAQTIDSSTINPDSKIDPKTPGVSPPLTPRGIFE